VKTAFIAFAALLAGSIAALAAEPAREMDTSAGKVLVNMDGMTLYSFDKDEAGKSNCYDQCATNWPPLAAEGDAMASGNWSVVERTDGSKMWAYKGMPLYTFIADKTPGDVAGDGKNGVWHVVKTN